MKLEQNAQIDLVGKTFDGTYKIEKLLGKGGMSIVYKATNVLNNQICAIKILQKPNSGYMDTEEYSQLAARLKREMEFWRILQHQNTAKVEYFGRSNDGTPYLVLEYIEGYSLGELLKKKGKLSPREALMILQPVAEVLKIAHSQSIIHRDLKPENIMVTDLDIEKAEVKLIDFGIAKLLTPATKTPEDFARQQTELTKAGAIIGTISYASPEQCGYESSDGGEIDRRSDIYSIGVIFYELISGFNPFQEKNFMATLAKVISKDRPQPLHEVRSGILEPFSKIIEQCLSIDRNNRPSSSDELVGKIHFALEVEGSDVIGKQKRYKRDKILLTNKHSRVYQATDLWYKDSSILAKIYDPSKTQQINKEIEKIKKFSAIEHPNIINVIEYGQLSEDDSYFFIYKQTNGNTIDAVAQKRNNIFELKEVIHYGKQISSAVYEFHKESLVQKYISPKHIIIENPELGVGGNAKIYSRSLLLDLTPEGEAFRTVISEEDASEVYCYQSPESMKGEEDFCNDVYSIVLTLSKMLLGDNLKLQSFEQADKKVTAVREAVANYNKQNPTKILPKELLDIIYKGISPQKENRYKSSGDLHKDISDLVFKIPQTTTEGRNNTQPLFIEQNLPNLIPTPITQNLYQNTQPPSNQQTTQLNGNQPDVSSQLKSYALKIFIALIAVILCVIFINYIIVPSFIEKVSKVTNKPEDKNLSVKTPTPNKPCLEGQQLYDQAMMSIGHNAVTTPMGKDEKTAMDYLQMIETSCGKNSTEAERLKEYMYTYYLNKGDKAKEMGNLKGACFYYNKYKDLQKDNPDELIRTRIAETNCTD